jgi:hypothetical protein
VSRILPNAQVIERNIVRHNTEAELENIRSTPTTIVLRDDDADVFRAEGVPTLNQVLAALAQAL